MNASRTTIVQAKSLPHADETKPGFRTKTISTRLTSAELAEVESGAERAGKPLSEWLRDAALTAARERIADPIELLLAEVWAVRHMLLSLFNTGAQATKEGKPMLTQSVDLIRDRADRRKREEARRMLVDFLKQQTEAGGEQL